MKKTLYLLIPVAVCFLVGFLGARFQVQSLAEWYPQLVKPSLTPPNWVFPIAWGILYLCMGLSVGLVLLSKSRDRNLLTTVFCVQLALNFLWSILFFALRNPLAGLIDIVLLDAAVIFYAVRSWKQTPAASVLFWPYAAWLLFASYLNLFILIHN